MILSRSNNLRFTAKLDERSGNDIIFGYVALAGTVKNYKLVLDSYLYYRKINRVVTSGVL